MLKGVLAPRTLLMCEWLDRGVLTTWGRNFSPIVELNVRAMRAFSVAKVSWWSRGPTAPSNLLAFLGDWDGLSTVLDLKELDLFILNGDYCWPLPRTLFLYELLMNGFTFVFCW